MKTLLIVRPANDNLCILPFHQSNKAVACDYHCFNNCLISKVCAQISNSLSYIQISKRPSAAIINYRTQSKMDSSHMPCRHDRDKIGRSPCFGSSFRYCCSPPKTKGWDKQNIDWVPSIKPWTTLKVSKQFLNRVHSQRSPYAAEKT